MKFGNAIKSTVGTIAVALLASTAYGAPASYFFGKDVTGPGGPNSVAAETLFGTQVLVTAAEDFGAVPPSPQSPQSPEYLYTSGNSRSTAVGALAQASTPPDSGSWGGSYVGGSVMSGSAQEGRYNTTGNTARGRWFETDAHFTLTLATAVQAFAFFGTDFGDFAGTLAIELFADASDVPLEFDNAAVVDYPNGVQRRSNVFSQGGVENGSLVFFGVASETSFNRIRFTLNQNPANPFEWDYLGFDDIRIGKLRSGGNVPEPGSLALAGLALFAAGWARKTQYRA